MSLAAPHEVYPQESNEDEGTEAPEEVHQPVVTLPIFYLAREMLQCLLLADKVFELVGRRVLHGDIRASAALHLLLLEDIAYVARLNVHLQRAFVLVYNDARSIALFHVALELAVGSVARRTAGQQGAVAVHKQVAQRNGNDHVDPGQANLRSALLVLILVLAFVLALILVVVHNL